MVVGWDLEGRRGEMRRREEEKESRKEVRQGEERKREVKNRQE